ncbi:MAG: hypothetical protein P1U89_14405 [Verrucomicrobiales bacterium]|nr:hypothetical protein [Verrucomicrobiales bacterium]
MTKQSPKAAASEASLHQHLSKIFPGCRKFPYWNRVGVVASGTGVYLGNGFVLTAGHVGPGHFVQKGGRLYPLVPNSARVYANSDGSLTDLCVFKVVIPKNSPLSRAEQLPVQLENLAPNTDILMIGAGYARGKRSVQWIDDQQVRWGMNKTDHVGHVPFQDNQSRTKGFLTGFGQGPMGCQGAPGDSGGAVFHYDYKTAQWKLSGLIIASTSHPDAGYTKLEDRTFIASLEPMRAPPVNPQPQQFSMVPKRQNRTMLAAAR